MRSKLSLQLLLSSVILFALSVFYSAPKLPARVATHFGASGQPNGWMTRDQHLLFIMLFGFGISAFVIGISFVIRFLPSSMLNVPKASYWRSPEAYPEACSIILRWSYAFGALNFLWMAALNYQIAVANRLTPPRLAPGQVLILSGIHIGLIGVLIVLLIREFAKGKNG